MMNLINPTQKQWQLESLRNDLASFFLHRYCNVGCWPPTHTRLFHLKMAWGSIRYLLGYYLKVLGMKVAGEKLSINGKRII